MSFYVDKSCSDITLNYAFAELLRDYKKIFAMAISGFVLTLLGFVV